MKALYTIQSKQMLFLIPKKNGKGYLKSCFGYHSSNDAEYYYRYNKPNWFAGDSCDIDGHLAIDIEINTWDADYKKGVTELIAVLKKCFPYVTEFIEDDTEFWKQLFKNINAK